tara:strand:- start:59888 stop:60382 length:495 start_codon:yes stop_codon:yes gene_type:complete
MDNFHIMLILAAFLCSLVAGFLFAYAIVVMPGIKNLSDNAFIHAFQVTDRIIQDNQPVFMLVWLGSAVAVVVAALLGFEKQQGADAFLLLFASVAYVFGVQLPTIAINLPLNNRLQSLTVEQMSEAEMKQERMAFESRWNRSNSFRTVIACCVSAALLILLLRQ